ncbi:uncharacterized protein J8A68_004721 [[Candida] subhashii]|uniref:Uncharacterized protein n=1 Tax=[Candida] subhashii TaxID=561895 RepID=A0A8J5UF63_9ASCO|nr:uncharacterized protein J8A68_004721 [[Candida] subhashii]KAG7661773.1 hypothetical protein J8A68_004721 [[Candida] subhashii]
MSANKLNIPKKRNQKVADDEKSNPVSDTEQPVGSSSTDHPSESTKVKEETPWDMKMLFERISADISHQLNGFKDEQTKLIDEKFSKIEGTQADIQNKMSKIEMEVKGQTVIPPAPLIGTVTKVTASQIQDLTSVDGATPSQPDADSFNESHPPGSVPNENAVPNQTANQERLGADLSSLSIDNPTEGNTTLDKLRMLARIQQPNLSIQEIEQLSYITDPNTEIEKLFTNYHEELRIKNHRDNFENECVSKNNSNQLPPPGVSNHQGFLDWVRNVILTKNTYLIPDTTIVFRLKENANKVKDSDLSTIVSIATEQHEKDRINSIEYRTILQYLHAHIDLSQPGSYANIETLISKGKTPVAVFIGVRHVVNKKLNNGELDNKDWINIWRKLGTKLPLNLKVIMKRMAQDEDRADLQEVTNLSTKKSDSELADQLQSMNFVAIWNKFDNALQSCLKRPTTPWNKAELAKSNRSESTSTTDQTNTEESKAETKKRYCRFCGSSNHAPRVCSNQTYYYKNGKVKFKNGKYHDENDVVLELEQGIAINQINANPVDISPQNAKKRVINDDDQPNKNLKLEKQDPNVKHEDDMNIDSEDENDENYDPETDNNKAEDKFKTPSKTAMDKEALELEKEAQEHRLQQYLEGSDENSSVQNQEDHHSKTNEQSTSAVSDNSSKQQRDSITGKFKSADNKKPTTEPIIKTINHSDYLLGKGPRKARASHYHINPPHKSGLYSQVLKNNTTVQMSIETLFSMCPSFRKFVNAQTKAILIPREGPINATIIRSKDQPKDTTKNNLTEAEAHTITILSEADGITIMDMEDDSKQIGAGEVLIITPDEQIVTISDLEKEFDSTIDSLEANIAISDRREAHVIGDPIYINAKLKGKPIKLKYDTGCMGSLINPETLKRLGLKLSEFPAVIKDANGGQKKVNGIIRTFVTVYGHDLPIVLIPHDPTPIDQILLGQNFLEHHKMFVGYLSNDDSRKLIFSDGNKLKAYQLTNNINQIENIEFTMHVETENQIDVEVPSYEIKNVCLHANSGDITLELTKPTMQTDLSEIFKEVLNESILNEQGKQYFLKQAEPFKEVFYVEGGSPGRLNPAVHPPIKIRLKPHKPWKMKTIPLGKNRPLAIPLLNSMLHHKQLVPSNAPYRNSWFIILKKNKQPRMLCDLRPLNENVEVEAAHPLNTEDLTSELAGRAFNTLIDVKNAYFQIPLDPETSDATSFLTPLGLLKYAVLPQGFTNSVSEFQNILASLLKDIAEDVFNFIDDIAVKGPLVDEYRSNKTLWRNHIDKVIVVFKILSNAGLKINPQKLKLAVEVSEFLGYRISPAGKTIVESKVEKLTQYTKPTSAKQLQSWLGLVNYYRQLIPAFSELTSPLYQITKDPDQKQRISWTAELSQRFHEINKLLASEPILTTIDYNQIISLHTDASIHSWSGVLQQTGDDDITRLIQCQSGKFHAAECHYTIWEKELLAIFRSLHSFHHTLLGYKGIIHIFCDNKAIEELLSRPLTNSYAVNRLYKWLVYIKGFNYQIHHIPGDKNVIADALTRMNYNQPPKLSYPLDEAITSFRQHLIIPASTMNITNDEPKYRQLALRAIYNYLQTLQVPTIYDNDKRKAFIHRAHEFYIDEGRLYKYGKNGQMSRLVVTDPQEIQKLFQLVHDGRGHMKIFNAFNILNSQYYIDHLYQLLNQYISSCPTCQQYDGVPKHSDPLYINLPAGLFEVIVCDCVYVQDQYMIVARDEFTGWVEAIITPELNGVVVARFIYNEIICRVGIFKVFKTDQGPEFKNSFVKTLLNRVGVPMKFTIADHPQANGVAERNHQPLINFFRKLPSGIDLADVLPTALWVDRTNIRRSTGYSAQYLVYGFQGHSQLSTIVNHAPLKTQYTEDELFKFRFQQLQARNQQHITAQSTISRIRTQSKEHYDTVHKTDNPINVGDLVLVWERSIKNALGSKTNKGIPRWSGPYRVKSKGDRVYSLETLSSVPLAKTFARQHLKLYIVRKSSANDSEGGAVV